MHNNINSSIELITAIDQAISRKINRLFDHNCIETNKFEFVDDVVGMVDIADFVDVIIAPPFTVLAKTVEVLHARNSEIKIAAQDLFWEDVGAYTGAVSGMMVKDAGATYAIVGHSERRFHFYETDVTVNQKIKAAWRNQLFPIVCVGESLAEHDAGKVEEVIERQVVTALGGLADEDLLSGVMITPLERIIIAYEPIWAIGVGETATPQYAEKVHAFIRKTLMQIFGLEAANKTKILYGGSVKSDNSKELLAQPNINGVLVGGASLKAEEFIGIIKNAVNCKKL